MLGPCQQDSLLPWVSGLWSPNLYNPLLPSYLSGPFLCCRPGVAPGVTSQAPAQPVSTVHGRHLESGPLTSSFPTCVPTRRDQELRLTPSSPLELLPYHTVASWLSRTVEATMTTQLHAVTPPPRYLLIQHTGGQGSPRTQWPQLQQSAHLL